MKHEIKDILSKPGRRAIYKDLFATIIEVSGPSRPRRWGVFSLSSDAGAPKWFSNLNRAHECAIQTNLSGLVQSLNG